jgi:hypothetical protein
VRQTVMGLMLANAALFLFGAAQHAGISIGPLREPVILPASIVETFCALCLIGGGVAVWTVSGRAWAAALAGNLAAIAGVIVGMVALAMGAGPRTASNDLYHRIMLALAGGRCATSRANSFGARGPEAIAMIFVC